MEGVPEACGDVYLVITVATPPDDFGSIRNCKDVYVASTDLLIIAGGDEALRFIVLTDDDDLSSGEQQDTVFATRRNIDDIGEITNLCLATGIATPGDGGVVAAECDGMPAGCGDFGDSA